MNSDMKYLASWKGATGGSDTTEDGAARAFFEKYPKARKCKVYRGFDGIGDTFIMPMSMGGPIERTRKEVMS